jgi:hypothetical protein
MITLLFCAISVLAVSACSNNNLKADTPENTAWLLKQAIDSKDIDMVNLYFTESRKGTISEAELEELSNLATAGSETRTYGFIQFDNGEMLLLDVVKGKDSYKIQDIFIVPEEMKSLFQNRKPQNVDHGNDNRFSSLIMEVSYPTRKCSAMNIFNTQ